MTPTVTAIMPCRGRIEQTTEAARRLWPTSGWRAWELAVVGADEDLPRFRDGGATIQHRFAVPNLTYWQALAHATERTQSDYIAALASDVLPTPRWLERAIEAAQARWPGGVGLMGFNGDGHGPEHSCHFLIHRQLLAQLGGWPTWYAHNFGDTELCQRAAGLGCYAKAAWAILYHNHPIAGAAADAIYAEGGALWASDQRLFEERRRLGWPSI